MSLLNRMTQLLKADAHGVVDSLEDRRLVLRQALREAEAELDRKKARRAALQDETRVLAEEGERLAQVCESLDADVELALDGEEAELARFSARKLLEARAAAAALQARATRVAREVSELEDRLARQEAELSSLKVRVREALERRESLDEPGCAAGVVEAEVELELLRRQRGRRGGA